MNVAVVSPHLDDAVLSVGGTIHEMTQRGVDVTIVTIFAGDPDASTPPSYWDAGRAATTQGDAVRTRRAEDNAAASALGATTVALPWSDSGYVAPRDPDAIWRDVAPVLESAATVLLPGWPLSHADHRYSTLLVLERIDPAMPIVFYAEQPYAAEPITLLKGMVRDRLVSPLRHAYGAEVNWRRHRLRRAARDAQSQALSQYAGELQNLGVRGRWGHAYRFVSGGEWLGVGAKTAVPAGLDLTA